MLSRKAQRLGAALLKRRKELGQSQPQLSARSGVDQSVIVRIEKGQITNPAPDKLARLAQALGLPLADVFGLAEYAVPSDLPTLRPYLRAKYRHLSEEDTERIEAYAARLARQRGVDLQGPAPGQDEAPAPTTAPASK